ncbi:MAG: OprD family outer membrane porin [Desulfobulbaceae bacterium]|nr:OprD family outer membrane porin [Desulfobulbaceae bacterium]
MKLSVSIACSTFTACAAILLLQGPASGAEEAPTLVDAFKQGSVKGQLKSYYFTQTFDGEGLDDSEIWVNGGNLSYTTAMFYGFSLGATFQASFVGHKDDDDGRTTGSMDAEGAVLSEAYLDYTWRNTEFKGGRQYASYPLAAVSGSRFIKESFEAYLLSNRDIPDTTITAGLVTKYQTRSDQSRYGDNWFVEFEQNGTGDPGDFYDIGDDGMFILYLKNSSVKNLALQAQYGNVFDEVAGYYADARYTIDVRFKPYIAGQIYYTDYDDSASDDNTLFGFKTGAYISDFEIFAGFTSAGGDEGDERVFRGVGQGAYYHYTATTKTSGAPAFEADTDAYQVGAAYTLDSLSARLLYTVFDNPAANADLDEYTMNFLYKFGGWAQGFSVSIDFSILDYEAGEKDATDLRTRLVYSF